MILFIVFHVSGFLLCDMEAVFSFGLRPLKQPKYNLLLLKGYMFQWDVNIFQATFSFGFISIIFRSLLRAKTTISWEEKQKQEDKNMFYSSEHVLYLMQVSVLSRISIFISLFWVFM